MNTQDTPPKRPYFRPTTATQRRRLLEIYEATGNIRLACARAHVGRRTFYPWLPRFREGGYPALDQTLSHAPPKPRVPPIAPQIAPQGCAYKRQHPSAGSQRITHAVRQAPDYQPVIGPTKVRGLLLEAGLVPARCRPGRKRAPEGAVHAPPPEETLNIALCGAHRS